VVILSDSDIIGRFYGDKKKKGDKTLAERGLSEQKRVAREDHRFYAGDRMTYQASVQDAYRKRMVVFNRIKPLVDPVQGFMMQNRRKTEFIARLQNDLQQQAYSQFMNGVVDYSRENANTDQAESAQDLDLLINGYGATDANISYLNNPDGEYAKEKISAFDVWWDPEARKTNLMDARYVFRIKKMEKEEAMDLFDRPAEDFEQGDGDATSQGGFEFFPQGGVTDKISFDSDRINKNMVNVFYYQWFQYEDYWKIENPIFDMENDPEGAANLLQAMEFIKEAREDEADDNEIDDIFSFDPQSQHLTVAKDLKNDLNALFKRLDISIRWKDHKFKRRVFYTAVLSGRHVFDKFKSPDQTGFTIKFKTASWDEENKRWFGMVAMLKEPARYSNKALTEMIYVIAANSKGGVMYEKDAVDNVAKFEAQYAGNNSAIAVNPGALSGGKIQPKAQPHLPNGYEEIKINADQALQEISPINAEFMGNTSSTQVSAALERQRIKQVTTTLAPLFDSITLYQKEDARQMVSFVKILAQNSNSRLVRLLGQDGAPQFVEMLEDNFADEYDVTIGEMPDTASQRELTEATMLTFARETAATLGVNLYGTAAKYIIGIKERDRQELIQALQPPEPTPEQQQAEQAAQQIQQAAAEASIANTTASTMEKQANAEKRISEALKTQTEVEQVEVETDQTILENIRLSTQPIDDFRVVI